MKHESTSYLEYFIIPKSIENLKLKSTKWEDHLPFCVIPNVGLSFSGNNIVSYVDGIV
jgi:hypothetical protein